MGQPQRADNDESEQSQGAGRRPIDTAKHGNVEIAIWKNQGSGGDFFTASSPTIRYKDGEEWKSGSSFGRHDLLDLAEAAREAATKIRDLSRGRNQGR